jgi:hypothetical protein
MGTSLSYIARNVAENTFQENRLFSVVAKREKAAMWMPLAKRGSPAGTNRMAALVANDNSAGIIGEC